ncbi:MAG TPA: carbohydrate kinase [Ktedonobacteraceae bacterium]|jgi:fructokinase|nr:carbohydrate kinase [Ktedonobacteraceae bacterium]
MTCALFIGEMLIDFIPHLPGLDGVICYQPHPGGAVANAAVALARLGGAARFVGKLSEDGFGKLLLRTLQENGVDTRFVPLTSRGNTALALVTLQEEGRPEFTFYRQGTADTLLEASDLTREVWQDVTLCHAGSVLLASEPARSATLAALEQAHLRGLLVSFDVNVRPLLWASQAEIRALLAQVVERVDLLKFSAEEAHYLDPALTEPLNPVDGPRLRELGQKLLDRGPSLVVITRGPLGALLLTRQQSVEAVGVPLQALDTTGAGDAFMGALLYKLMQQNWPDASQLAALPSRTLQEFGEFANRAAGLSCTRYGGIASLPLLAELERS